MGLTSDATVNSTVDIEETCVIVWYTVAYTREGNAELLA